MAKHGHGRVYKHTAFLQSKWMDRVAFLKKQRALPWPLNRPKQSVVWDRPLYGGVYSVALYIAEQGTVEKNTTLAKLCKTVYKILTKT